MLKISSLFFAITILLNSLTARAGDDAPEWRHGLSHFGELKYPPDFQHFDWVNPAAPGGGELTQGVLGMWDSFNPFINRGRPVAGVALVGDYNFLYDRLLEHSDDEPTARYGRLAEAVRRGPDNAWIEFRLRPEAHWHDGRPITVEDILWTFEMMKEHGAANLQMLYADVTIEQTGPRSVRFNVGDKARNASLLLDIGRFYPLPRHYFVEGEHDFNATWSEPPLGSGPYRVSNYTAGRSITFERVPDYWGRDLPVNRGRYNFDRFTMEYFLDLSGVRAAIKAGVVDYWAEFNAMAWQQSYDIDAVDAGLLVKTVYNLTTGGGLGGYPFFFNLRLPKFQDIRVREALWLARDFAYANRVIYHSMYQRVDSFFHSSPLERDGLPSAAELELLEPLRDHVPPRVFTHERQIYSGSGFGPAREQLLKADALLKEAGWIVDENGVRVNAQTGEPFTIEFILTQTAQMRNVLLYTNNLKKLGIDASARLLEGSNFTSRLRQRDFEAMCRGLGQALFPGTELRSYFGSAAADQPFTSNYAGVRDPAVDALIEAVIAADSREEMEAAGRALDRVMLWNFYAVPGFATTGAKTLYWDRFGFPEDYGPYDRSFPTTWWFDPERDATTRAKAKSLGIGKS